MAEFFAVLNTLTWPGAIALSVCAVAAAVVLVVFIRSM